MDKDIIKKFLITLDPPFIYFLTLLSNEILVLAMIKKLII